MSWTVRIKLLVGDLLAGAFICATLIIPAPAAHADPPPPSTPMLGYYLDWDTHGHSCDPARPRHKVIIVQWFWAALGEHGCTLSAIRQQHPDARILAYQNIAGMLERPADNPSTPVSCVTREEANDYEAMTGSSFYLHPRAGHGAATEVINGTQRIVFESFPDIAAADLSDPSYRAVCASKLPVIAAHGFDGVFFDDVNTWPGHGWGQYGSASPGDPGAALEYPTDAGYGEAMVNLVRDLAEDAAEVGLYTAGNVGVNPWVPALRGLNRRMLTTTDPSGGAPLSAQFREFWMCWADCEPVLVDSEWGWNAYLMQQAESLGRDFLTQSGRGSGGEAESGISSGAVEYAQASWWLMWNGQQTGSAWGFWDNRSAVHPHLSPDIGTPIDPVPLVADGQPQNMYWCLSECRFMRQYTRGMVVVNARAAGPHTFEFDEWFRHPETGYWVHEVTLGPGEGMVLLDY